MLGIHCQTVYCLHVIAILHNPIIRGIFNWVVTSICLKMNHYKRISPVWRFYPVWFSTYFTGDFKGFLKTIVRLRCDKRAGWDCGDCEHCQCRRYQGCRSMRRVIPCAIEFDGQGTRMSNSQELQSVLTAEWRTAAFSCNPLWPSYAYSASQNILVHWRVRRNR